jgi:hypothetical protein
MTIDQYGEGNGRQESQLLIGRGRKVKLELGLY